MCAQVQAQYNQLVVVVVQWPAELFAQPSQLEAGVLTPTQAAAYELYMQHLQAEISVQDLEDISFLQVNGSNAVLAGRWCDSHPDAAAHEYIAEEIVSHVQSVYPGWSFMQPATGG